MKNIAEREIKETLKAKKEREEKIKNLQDADSHNQR